MFFKLIFFVAVTFMACSAQQADPVVQPVEKPAVDTPPKEEPTSQAASSNSVDARVAESKARLEQSAAGKVVWRSIEASGGLKQWLSYPLGFRFQYKPRDRDATDTYQVVDTFSSKARHSVVFDEQYEFDGNHQEFGWDGEKAWTRTFEGEVSPTGAMQPWEANKMPKNPRFWALTPYYFVGMPFVLADPGVVLNAETDAEIDGKLCDVVRVTFEANVGDAPDDYYVLYFDKKTSRVAALRYIVSYRGFFPDGGHTPEKLMVYEGTLKTDEGPIFAESYPTYKWDGTKRGEKVTDIVTSDLKFEKTRPADFFALPKGAKIHEGN